MDINKALTFVTEDEEWVTKIGIGAVMAFLSFLIIPGLIIAGYMVAITRNVMNNDPRPLPAWDNWGKFLSDGFYLAVAGFVYTLPFSLLVCCGVFSTVGFSGLSDMSEEAAAGGIFASFGLIGCLAFLFALAMLFIIPALTIQYAREGNLGACFRFSEVIAIARDNIGDILIAFAVSLGLNFVIGLVAAIPLLGWLIALAGFIYISVVQGHLYGQIGRKMGGMTKEEKFSM